MYEHIPTCHNTRNHIKHWALQSRQSRTRKSLRYGSSDTWCLLCAIRSFCCCKSLLRISASPLRRSASFCPDTICCNFAFASSSFSLYRIQYRHPVVGGQRSGHRGEQEKYSVEIFGIHVNALADNTTSVQAVLLNDLHTDVLLLLERSSKKVDSQNNRAW